MLQNAAPAGELYQRLTDLLTRLFSPEDERPSAEEAFLSLLHVGASLNLWTLDMDFRCGMQQLTQCLTSPRCALSIECHTERRESTALAAGDMIPGQLSHPDTAKHFGFEKAQPNIWGDAAVGDKMLGGGGAAAGGESKRAAAGGDGEAAAAMAGPALAVPKLAGAGNRGAAAALAGNAGAATESDHFEDW